MEHNTRGDSKTDTGNAKVTDDGSRPIPHAPVSPPAAKHPCRLRYCTDESPLSTQSSLEQHTRGYSKGTDDGLPPIRKRSRSPRPTDPCPLSDTSMGSRSPRP